MTVCDQNKFNVYILKYVQTVVYDYEFHEELRKHKR